MKKEAGSLPTELELTILNVLWNDGPSTVREVHNIINKTRETGYTTVLKMLQIMTQKNLVRRDESNHAHVYMPNCSKKKTQKRLLDDLLKKAFDGSSVQLASTMFEPERLSICEFEKLRNEIIALQNEESEDGNSRSC